MPIRKITRTTGGNGEPGLTPAASAPLRARSHRADDEDPDGQPAGPGYEVGRGKPPVHSRFKKGKSGNPAGRPREARGLNTIVRENLLAKVQVRTSQGTRNMPRIEALVHKLLELAMKGDQRAAAKLLSIYAVAVPEQPANEARDKPVELGPTDEAILALYRDELLREAGSNKG